MPKPESELTIDVFQTLGSLDDPHPPKWVAVILDASGSALFTSGQHDTEQSAEDDVTRQYAATAA